jgi:tRNA dimethylallyltransferase
MLPSELDFRIFWLSMNKGTLLRRVDHRCETMVQTGLVDEVLDLIQRGHFANAESPPANSIGYAETYSYLHKFVQSQEYNERIRIFR